MAVYFVTGGLGSGKSLAAVMQLRQYAANGCRIAGNLDIYLDKFASTPFSKQTYCRLPDRPKAHDFFMLGLGKPADNYDEDDNGLIVLDELATWLNSHTWQDKDRAALRDWFVHSRKYGWDIIFLVQSIEAVDRQLIELLMEYHVPVSNLSKINVPIIGRLWRNFSPRGKPLKLPKIHTAAVLYKNKVNADRWTFRATHLYSSYDTKQVITDNWPHATYSMLTRWHMEGRYLTQRRDFKFWLALLPKIAIHFACGLLRKPVPYANPIMKTGKTKPDARQEGRTPASAVALLALSTHGDKAQIHRFLTSWGYK